MRFSRDKDVETFLKLIVATGKVSLAPGGKHVRLFWRETGAPVMDRGFPVVVSSSPSAPSWRKAATDQLVRCGVFERARTRRRAAYQVKPLAERARELMLSPRPDRGRVAAVCREIAALDRAAQAGAD